MIELRAGRLRCELHPDLGGAVAGLWLDGEPVLRSTPAARLDSARQAACFALVPFSNRIGQASVVWQGTQQPLVRHTGDDPHAIHGLAWHRPWSVLDSDEASAMLACEHRSDSAWPFAFDCSHTLRVQPGSLEMTLALTNQSGKPAPAGLGWQAWFPLRPRGHLAFAAAASWELGPEKLPMFRKPDAGLDADTSGLELDRCYEGWDGVALLRDASLQVRVRSELTRLVVYRGADEEAICIAPVSHACNAVHLYAAGAPAADLGLRVLQPGETLVAQMTIEVEAAP